jgi:sodium transport system ATP-binding protein
MGLGRIFAHFSPYTPLRVLSGRGKWDEETDSTMIETTDLQKAFHSKWGETKAVDGISLRINEGEVFGILGPNGAGKTTFFRLLSCLLKPTGGTAEVSGYDIIREPMKVRERIGLLCEEPGLYDKQSVNDNLELFGALYGLDASRTKQRVSDLAGSLEFRDLLGKRAGTLSKGQRQKVSLARALLHEPEVLLLDEPTANLDPETAEKVRNSIRALHEDEKRTVLVTSHNLDEVQRICEKVAIIDEGKVVESGAIDVLSSRIWAGRKVTINLRADHALEGTPLLDQIRREQPVVTSVDLVPGASGGLTPTGAKASPLIPPIHYRLEVVLRDSASEDDQENVTSELVKIIATATDLRVTSVEAARHSLQEVYLKLLRDKEQDEAAAEGS